MGYQIIDQYSLLHFSVGIIGYFLGIKFELWLLINILFEIIENSNIGIKVINKIHIWPGGKKSSDTLINSASDIVFAMLGWWIAKQVDIFGKKYGLYNKPFE